MTTQRSAGLSPAMNQGFTGARFYGFGSLWMAWQRRGDFAADIQALRDEHGVSDELKWNKAGSKQNQYFFEDLIEYFYKRPWASVSLFGSSQGRS